MKKEKNENASNSAEAGIRVLTVALFIILLAFFIVLNSLAVVDERNTLAALGSLTGSFGILPGGLSASKEGEVRVISSEQIPIESRETETVELSRDGVSGMGNISTTDISRGKTISIQDKVIFDEGSYKIKPAAYEFLKRIAAVINSGNSLVEITGHTDDLPSDEKSSFNNQELSSLRALEVFKFFVVIGKVLPSRLISYGCAEYRPIASNETRETRMRNRRVDIVFVQDSPGNLRDIYQKDPSAFIVFKRFVFHIFD